MIGRADRHAPRVLAIVPARGGSKGIPRKNLALLDGHPLVAWSIAAALASPDVDRTVCTTDDGEIAAAAIRYGAEVPFLRPAELAGDDALDLPVFIHVLDELEKRDGWRPDLVVQLRPTAPLRPEGLVSFGIALLSSNPAATSARSVTPAPHTPYKMWRPPGSGHESSPYLSPLLTDLEVHEPWNAPRQSLPHVLWHNGVLDVIRTDTLAAGSMTGDRILPLEVDPSFAVDIDAMADLERIRSVVTSLTCVRPGPTLAWDRVRLLALDVDGTLTPGSMYYDESGERMKVFHTHDGRGIAQIQSLGVRVALITQEGSGFTQARAKKLGIDDVRIGVLDKPAVLAEVCRSHGLTLAEVAYLGDDDGDLDVLCAVRNAGGIPCAVADSRPSALQVAQFITQRTGGHGAVRDVCDRIATALSESATEN